ncbi:MAG TPA: BRO family protein [Dokdonella sp.]|uniref:BRO family protein n=1 Tax=Dokdonella sp. TaxID=2291710 RepID=UPI002D7EE0DA|nr:BRO family protein [Dokdonella sp.]HET9033879.1 BRO family protein [Dokdonella sp.]
MSKKEQQPANPVDAELAAFESQVVRRTWHNDEWWFAIVDVVAVLTDSIQPEGYLKDLRKRDAGLAEGWGQIASPLRLATPGGVQLLNCANMQGVLRVIQSIPSPKAEPFKRWLAQVGYERIQEVDSDNSFAALNEDQRRLMLRDELSEHNKHLAAAAQQAGVETPVDYAVFQNHGYKGLYGGLGNKELHALKGLKKSHKILDHMGSTELAANLFRATQTEDKLKRDGIKGKSAANRTHYEVGKKVRQTIEEIGGTMPEHLAVPDKSIQQIEREKRKHVGKDKP